MTKANPFVLEKAEYKRDINPIRHYVSDVAFYLSIETGRPLEECRAYVTKQLRPGGKFEFKDPTVHYLERNEHGDREEKSCGMRAKEAWLKGQLNNHQNTEREREREKRAITRADLTASDC